MKATLRNKRSRRRRQQQKQRQKQSRRLARRQQQRFQQRGGAPQQFTVMTYNTEVYHRIFSKFLNKDADGKVTESPVIKGLLRSQLPLLNSYVADIGDAETTAKVRLFESLFAGVDIACLQEDVLINLGAGGYQPFLQVVGGLPLSSICHSHDFSWDITKQLYGEGGRLANSIYSKMRCLPNPHSNELCGVFPKGRCEISDRSNPTPRCYASSQFDIGGKIIKVVSVHLSGGRFEDGKGLLTDDSAGEKERQMTQILDSFRSGAGGAIPDIICGDLNAKFPTGIADPGHASDGYFQLLVNDLYKDGTTYATLASSGAGQAQLTIYWDRYKRWTSNIYDFMCSYGGGLYKPAFGAGIRDTTMYGGTVDMIFYNDTTIAGVVDSAGRVFSTADTGRVDGTMVRNAAGKWDAYISDHAPVKVTFQTR